MEEGVTIGSVHYFPKQETDKEQDLLNEKSFPKISEREGGYLKVYFYSSGLNNTDSRLYLLGLNQARKELAVYDKKHNGLSSNKYKYDFIEFTLIRGTGGSKSGYRRSGIFEKKEVVNSDILESKLVSSAMEFEFNCHLLSKLT